MQNIQTLHLAVSPSIFHFTLIVSYLLSLLVSLTASLRSCSPPPPPSKTLTRGVASLSICLIPHVPAVVSIPSRLRASHLAGFKSNPPARHRASLACAGKSFFFSGVIIERIHCLLGFEVVFRSHVSPPHGTNQIWVRASKYQNRSLIIIFFVRIVKLHILPERNSLNKRLAHLGWR